MSRQPKSWEHARLIKANYTPDEKGIYVRQTPAVKYCILPTRQGPEGGEDDVWLLWAESMRLPAMVRIIEHAEIDVTKGLDHFELRLTLALLALTEDPR